VRDRQNPPLKVLKLGADAEAKLGTDWHRRRRQRILTAAGYNVRRILAWLRMPLRKLLGALWRAFAAPAAINPAC
jgi:hypothetical protein